MFLALVCMSSFADKPQYTKADSIKVMELLKAGKKQKKGTNLMVFFARQLRDVPYVAQTLEVNNKERLVINLRQLDCTTYVENVLALKRCIDSKKYSFNDFCNTLRQIRYDLSPRPPPSGREPHFVQYIERMKDGTEGY